MNADTLLMLENDGVERRFDAEACLGVFERAHRAQATGSAADRPRMQGTVAGTGSTAPPDDENARALGIGRAIPAEERRGLSPIVP